MKHYKPLKVELLEFAGLSSSLRAMRLPKKQAKETTIDEDLQLAGKLILAGTEHAKFTRGLNVWIKLECQMGWLIEYVTYKIGVDNLSSSSAMHGELKNLQNIELAEQKQTDLPDKVYTRIEVLNYQALRNIYLQRVNHRHPDWRKIFCPFVEDLPYFDTLIMPRR